MLSSDTVISATYDHQGLHNLPAHANIFFQVTAGIILSTVATQKTQLLAAGRITYTEHPPCREELLCCQCFALVFYTWSSPILSYGKVKLRTGFKTPLRCEVLILEFRQWPFQSWHSYGQLHHGHISRTSSVTVTSENYSIHPLENGKMPCGNPIPNKIFSLLAVFLLIFCDF